MKDLRGNKKGLTLSLKLCMLRYNNARNRHVNKYSISDLRFTKDLKAWLKDKENRKWLTYNKDYVYIRL